jgi:hypothetical protein
MKYYMVLQGDKEIGDFESLANVKNFLFDFMRDKIIKENESKSCWKFEIVEFKKLILILNENKPKIKLKELVDLWNMVVDAYYHTIHIKCICLKKYKVDKKIRNNFTKFISSKLAESLLNT